MQTKWRVSKDGDKFHFLVILNVLDKYYFLLIIKFCVAQPNTRIHTASAQRWLFNSHGMTINGQMFSANGQVVMPSIASHYNHQIK